MSSPVTPAVATKTSAAADLRDTFLGAAEHLTWRVVGATLAIAVALEAWLVVDVVFGWSGQEPRLPAAEAFLSRTIVNLLMAFCIMFTTLVADERAARGARRLPAYAWGVVVGSAVAALAQWEVHQWLHLRTHMDVPGIPHEVAVMQPAFAFFEYLIWGSIIVFIYVNRRAALLATARMNAAQVQRADAQRRTLESRLQALQARVEPQFLFNTLARVRELYESDPAKGSQMLGDLIVYLRAALPRLRNSTSTVEREAELAGAYLNIMRGHLRDRLAVDIGVAQSARSACMPPMILLPLLDHALLHGAASSATGGTIRLAANVSAAMLRVEITDSGAGFAAWDSRRDPRDLQDRLHVLYGDRARLAFEAEGALGSRAVLDIPYESADGDHC